ncbi:sugar ABC transporter permease [Lactiplantibacillus garii]|uniref:Sugar ABC transporter permease n=1 Tax=Lactiplantibacillus garii TaxID=2306423 RepID=A0A426D6D1_9LACO|nr:sugar ABC transporter permease [Lactiplantibacillus garii]RRK10185.1 sugar ABC transporter permease [Lactiplantibacillus garii]
MNGVNERTNRIGWWFIGLSIIGFVVFMLYPILNSVKLVFSSISGDSSTFVGFGNFVRLFHDNVFWSSLGNSFLFLIVEVPIMLIFAIVLAVVLNSKKLKLRGFWRLLIFLPCVTSLVSYSVLFKMLFSSDGLINTFLMNTLHVISAPIPWLTDPVMAKVVIILALLWRWTGYNMIFFLAGLQNVSEEIYEAAEIDGASKVQQFLHITLPALRPIILFTAVQSTISTLQLFDEPMNITAGGPNNSSMTIAMYIYNVSFKFVPNFGYAASLSYVVMFIILILSLIQMKVAKNDD